MALTGSKVGDLKASVIYPTWFSHVETRRGWVFNDGRRPAVHGFEMHGSGCLNGSWAERHGFRRLLVQLLQRHG